ncbi:MAG TPA: hypothetical protein VI916_07515 [Acidimicrobiia bacterium]|nr:hypothetical protein [Acidimicrobiia bacterium]
MPDRPPIDAIFRQHLGEVAFWQSVADMIADELRKIVQHTKIPAKVEARAKTTGSVIGKAHRKPEVYSSLAAFDDLAGARVLVPFEADVVPVAQELRDHPYVVVIRDEIKVRKPDELSYQARHLDLELAPAFGLTLPEDFGNRTIRCEVQIQTFAQSLWASISHLVSYKRDLPDDVRSRINRLVVLCEMFDDEAAESRRLAFKSLDALGLIVEEVQRYFFGITGTVHDPEQAFAIVARLLPALDETEQAMYPSLLETFVDDYGDRLTMLLTDRPEARELPWLLRPEVILILERLTRKRSRLAHLWAREFPQADLDAIEAAWGPIHSGPGGEAVPDAGRKAEGSADETADPA